jgi:ABC-type transport system involved in multi-copper enzyme maturation permease subunit
MTAVVISEQSPTRRSPRLSGIGWVTWRQHRLALAGVLFLLGALSVLLVWQGMDMHAAYARLGLDRCGPLEGSGCQLPLQTFEQQYQNLPQFLPRFLEFIPGLLGMFVGAPLVARELESGTFRFAWTQGTHRLRWISVKLALLGAALALMTLIFSALFGWWYGPWGPLMGRMVSGQAYEITGVVFAARTVFAFALGAFLGTLIRRTVPAMAATAAAWAAVVVPSVLWLRPLIQQPVAAPANSSLITSSGWVIHNWIQDPAGRHLGRTQLLQAAGAAGANTSDAFNSWLALHHYTNWVSYQPENRFWHFQTIEGAAYVLLTVLLGAATISWVRYRAS